VTNVRTKLLGAAVVVLVAVGIFFYGFASGRESVLEKWAKLAAQVEMTNRLAEQRLVKLKADRDRKEAELHRLAEEREKLDEQAKSEISRLAARLEQRPVRVRVVTDPRACSGGPEGDATAGTGSGEANAGEATGLLPESNSGRLREALTEIETLSAAYNSCRSYLLTLREVPP